MPNFLEIQIIPNPIIKVLRIIAKIVVRILSVIFLLVSIILILHYFSDLKLKRIIKNEDFVKLHTSILSLDKLSNFAILPNDSFIVVNGTVINYYKLTYGTEPEFGFYNNYYESGIQKRATSFDMLVSNVNIDSITTMTLIENMKKSGIVDIKIIYEPNYLISYWTEVSAMYCEKGIIYSIKELNPTNYKGKLDSLGDHFFFYKSK